MPVEFVSSERDGQYIVFKVLAPSSDMDRIKTLTPGVWSSGSGTRTLVSMARAKSGSN